jgi:mono/diheme cytochrome c family protein
MVFLGSALALFAVLVLGGCRGYRSEKTALHLNPNLDWQAKYKTQTLSMMPPDGTVPWGSVKTFNHSEDGENYLKDDESFFEGKGPNGEWMKKAPVNVTEAFVKRGQERFNIYCSACHDRAGTGRGPVVLRGFVPPPNFSDDRIIAYTDGEIFNVISHGIRTMPSYAKQIPEIDRWAIITYVRALQKSRLAHANDLSNEMRKQLK